MSEGRREKGEREKTGNGTGYEDIKNIREKVSAYKRTPHKGHREADSDLEVTP